MILGLCVFFFFKQKTAYEMRISDWSSDVCSSDLPALHKLAARGWLAETHRMHCLSPAGKEKLQELAGVRRTGVEDFVSSLAPEESRTLATALGEDGRASCRERGGRYVEISVGAGALKKKNKVSADVQMER